jgi:hypothetical protein
MLRTDYLKMRQYQVRDDRAETTPTERRRALLEAVIADKHQPRRAAGGYGEGSPDNSQIPRHSDRCTMRATKGGRLKLTYEEWALWINILCISRHRTG